LSGAATLKDANRKLSRGFAARVRLPAAKSGYTRCTITEV
jgi:hypothetical protein